MNLEFLKSERFWKLFLVGATAALEEYVRSQRWEQALLAGIAIWLGGSVVVGTTDRLGKNIGGVTPAVSTVEDEQL
jgi:hypothetical protein